MSRKRSGQNLVKVVDMLGLLVRAPRTMAELVELTGMGREAIHWWLRLMVEEGLLRKEAHYKEPTGCRVFKYFWSPPCTPQD